MKGVLIGGACAIALFGVWAATARAQVRGDVLTLVGPGSAIGVSVEELQSDEAAKLKIESGVRIQTVQEGTPAARAGFKAGDVMVEFDGERVRGVTQLTRLVRETPPGRGVKATVVRNGARQTLTVTPEMGRAGNPSADSRTNISPFVDVPFNQFTFTPYERFGVGSPGQLGVSVTALESQLAGYFGVKQGVLVSAVEPGTPAAAAGLKAGDVITAVGGRAVDQPSQVVEAVRALQPGASVEIKIVRDKKEMTVKAAIGERVRAYRLLRDAGRSVRL
jgi:serine protease Do